MKKLILLLLSFFALSVFAASPPTTHWAYKQPGAWFPSYAAACNAWFTERSAMETDPKVSLVFRNATDTSCSAERMHANYGSYGFVGASLIKKVRCPNGYTLGNGLCEDTVCKSKQGQDFTLNWQVGYTRTSNIDEDPNWKLVAPPTKPPSDGLVCDPVTSCKVALVLIPTKTWQSLSPTSQGLYRLSVDFDAQHMGESCTPTPAENTAAHPAANKPTCPGFVGEVNGVPGCYGTASNPTSADVPESKPQPPEAGNPPAGKKPDSGEGSGTGGAGRTPSTGDGGPAGGPAAAAGSGTKPDGTPPKPEEGKEQANCGAPGQPKCGIDEGGTPSKFDGDKAALDGWKSAVEANRATIKDADGSFFDSYSMFFAVPPIVPCEPIELPNDQVLTRQCDVVEGTRSVMSYIWALAAIWICLGWIREAI